MSTPTPSPPTTNPWSSNSGRSRPLASPPSSTAVNISSAQPVSRPTERPGSPTPEESPLPVSTSQHLSIGSTIAIKTSSSIPPSPAKRLRSPSSEVSPLPVSKLQDMPAAQERTSKALPLPPVGMFAIGSSAVKSRDSAPLSSLSKHRPQTPSRPSASRQITPCAMRQGPLYQARPEKLPKSSAALEALRRGKHQPPSFPGSSSAAALASVRPFTAMEATSPSTFAPQPSPRLAPTASYLATPAVTADVSGVRNEDTANYDNDSAMTAAQASLAQLTSTLQRALTALTNAEDIENIIKALQALKKDGNTKLAMMKTPLRPPTKPSNPPSQDNDATATARSMRELLSRIGAAHNHGYKSGFKNAHEAIQEDVATRLEAAFRKGVAAAAKEHAKQLNHCSQPAYDDGYKTGFETAQKITQKNAPRDTAILAKNEFDRGIETGFAEATQKNKEAREQLKQCKEWLCGIIRARDAGEKAQMGALISKAETVGWLEYKPGNGDAVV